jgi:hypothetical protein
VPTAAYVSIVAKPVPRRLRSAKEVFLADQEKNSCSFEQLKFSFLLISGCIKVSTDFVELEPFKQAYGNANILADGKGHSRHFAFNSFNDPCSL